MAKNKDGRTAHKVVPIKLVVCEDSEGRVEEGLPTSDPADQGHMAAAGQIKRLGLGGVRLQLSSQFRQLKSASSKLVTMPRGKKTRAFK